ncbi:unnamed protein product [Somion occarium]|uniref:Uncharacterized protein n=1 Tax=Somion occarium TaxID=3059160 RepID=A0ABP1E8S3_9APHY
MTSVYHWPSGKRLIQFIDTPSTTHPSVLPLHDHLLVIRINEKCVVLDVYKLQERNSGSDGLLATFGFPPIHRNAFVVESVLIPPCTSSYNILNPSQRHPLFYMEPVLVGVLIQVEFLFYIFTVPTAIFQPGQFIPEYSPRSPIESKIIPWTAWGERYTCVRTATNRSMPMRIFGYNVFTEDEIFNFNPYSHHSLMRHYFQSSVAEYVTLTQALTGDDGRGGFTCDIVSRFPHWKVPLNRPEAVTEATSCEPFESGDGPMLLCISDSEFAAEVYSLG